MIAIACTTRDLAIYSRFVYFWRRRVWSAMGVQLGVISILPALNQTMHSECELHIACRCLNGSSSGKITMTSSKSRLQRVKNIRSSSARTAASFKSAFNRFASARSSSASNSNFFVLRSALPSSILNRATSSFCFAMRRLYAC